MRISSKGQGAALLMLVFLAMGSAVLVASNLQYITFAPVTDTPFSFGVPGDESWPSFEGASPTNIEYVQNDKAIELNDTSSDATGTWRSYTFTNSSGSPNSVNEVETWAEIDSKSNAYLVLEGSTDFSTFGVQEEKEFKIAEGNDTIDNIDFRANEIRFDVVMNNSNNGRTPTVYEVILYGSEKRQQQGIFDQRFRYVAVLLMIVVALVAVLGAAGQGW